jgi:hypothetical protein
MAPAQAAASFRTLIERYIRVDKWGLNFPDQVESPSRPPSIAREESVARIETDGYFQGQGGSPVVVSMRFAYTVMFRFPAVLQYHQLPRDEANTRLAQLLAIAPQDASCLNADFREVEGSGEILVAEETNGDWFIVYKINFDTSFVSDDFDLTPTTDLMGG